MLIEPGPNAPSAKKKRITHAIRHNHISISGLRGNDSSWGAGQGVQAMNLEEEVEILRLIVNALTKEMTRVDEMIEEAREITQ